VRVAALALAVLLFASPANAPGSPDAPPATPPAFAPAPYAIRTREPLAALERRAGATAGNAATSSGRSRPPIGQRTPRSSTERLR